MKIVVGITGASGSIYAQRLIKYLSESPEVEKISVVFSDNAHEIYLSETGEDIAAKKNIELKKIISLIKKEVKYNNNIYKQFVKKNIIIFINSM